MSQRLFAILFAALILSLFFLTEPELVQHSTRHLPLEEEETYLDNHFKKLPILNESEAPEADEANEGAKPLQTPKTKEFSVLTEKTLRVLPTLQQLQALPPEEVHHAPEAIHEAGRALGTVAQYLSDYPEVKPIALEFYHDCFEREDLAPSVRALCLSNHRALRIEDGGLEEWSGDEIKVHSEVKRLASFISKSN